MRVTVLHNAVPLDAPPEDQDTLVQVDAISGALARLGHEPAALPCGLDLAAMREELSRQRPDVVFSLVESLAGADSLVYLPAAVLDVLGVPYCGCPTESLFLTTHKTLAKERMQQAGLPTPGWMESHMIFHEGHEDTDRNQKGEEDEKKKYRSGSGGFRNHERTHFAPSHSSLCPSCSSWILKGVWDQGSRGMDDAAVLRDVELIEVRERLAERATAAGRPCFAEQFIEGREFNLGLLAGPDGPESLPPAEIDFSTFPPEKPRIVGHRAKWDADSFEYSHTPRHFDFPPSDAPLLDRLRNLAQQCWTLFKLRGWARVDFRVDAAGEPWILEVNGNPCLSPDAGFAAAMEQASIPYDRGIQRIVDDALFSPRRAPT